MVCSVVARIWSSIGKRFWCPHERLQFLLCHALSIALRAKQILSID